MTANELERTFLPDLYAHHRWAMAKVFDKCRGLSDADLDRTEPLGFGSLRATLVHLHSAEWVWHSRFGGVSPTSFPVDRPWPVDEVENELRKNDKVRQRLLAEESVNGYTRVVGYRTFAGVESAERIGVLLLHVANHAVHHRAQVLQFLRLAGVKIPGGLDFVFFRIAQPTVEIPPEVANACRGYGLEVGAETLPPRRFDPAAVRFYSGYSDWALARIFALAEPLSNSDLDREFPMGMGTVRKTLAHIVDAERFWRSNWRGETAAFPKSPADASLADLRAAWQDVSSARNASLVGWSMDDLQRVVHANFGAGLMPLRIGESAVQLCVHGTHHRAQALNMLRRLGATVPAFDLVLWVREEKPTWG